MKNLVKCFIVIMLMSVGSSLYAQNWIPYQETIQPVVQTQVVYIAEPQPVVIYQWVPYVVQQNVIVEQQRIFCRTQTVVTRPFTHWILQPMVIYR
jgi:hypothetical protein